MQRERDIQTAKRFGITSQCERLEADLLKIPGVVDVEFDLDGFYDDLHQVIFLTKYDLHPERPDYWQARREMLQAIIRTAEAHELFPTDDRIEDYGEHFYFVRRCGQVWRQPEDKA